MSDRNLDASKPAPVARPLQGISRRFGDLRVRPKLMVLHNSFFLVLTLAVYFALVPLVESRLSSARVREVSLIWNSFATVTPQSGESDLRVYDLETGTGDELGLPRDAQEWMKKYPGRIWRLDPASDHIFKLIGGSNRYYRLRLPVGFYDGLLARIKLVVFAVLGVSYVLAVLLLELLIMPLYVYQPLRLMLEADAATRRGDRAAERLPASFIPGDEIGQIMHSHNETVGELRRQEDILAAALQELETTASDLREKNDLLAAAKRNLEAQDRLVSLGMLSASVAHEMNTPLAVLHGSIEKLVETVEDEGALSRLRRALRVTERLRKISEGLLDFARLRRKEVAPVAIRPLVEEAWQLVAIDEKAAEIAFENAVPGGALVHGNADRLVQVFVNLLRNAMNAAPAGGHVRAAAHCCQFEGKPAVTITVDDDGPGIPAEVLPDIFEAFVTTRLDARGTGLGLTVAEGIVHQHGGSIKASNRPGGGARLEVILPGLAMEEKQR